MKLIGVEVRVGASQFHGRKLEALIVPLDIRFARAADDPYMHSTSPVAEVTFHTTDGDVTVIARLPMTQEDSLVMKNAEECHRFLRQQVEQ